MLLAILTGVTGMVGAKIIEVFFQICACFILFNIFCVSFRDFLSYYLVAFLKSIIYLLLFLHN